MENKHKPNVCMTCFTKIFVLEILCFHGNCIRNASLFQVMEQKLEEKKSETYEDDKEHEKMIFSLVFNGNPNSGNIQQPTGNGFGNVMNASKDQEQSKQLDMKKLNLMKKIAKVINPLVYVLFAIFYFIYYMLFFSQ